MELKDYQQQVINDIEQFTLQVKEDNNLRLAYENFWNKKGVSPADVNNDYLHPYINTIKGVPRITVKVPTAGGKTFIACNAIKTIFDNYDDPMKPKVVAWFVPSDTIRKQTLQNLSNPQHPYRQKIDTHFNNRVCVVDIEKALFGQGISPDEVRNQLTIFVLSVQSLAGKKKDALRAKRENTYLADYSQYYGTAQRIQDADETSLMQVLSFLNPVCIIDESHNFTSELRVDALNWINPCFVLNLTATPRGDSNIVSFVDAMKLKKANMVKLPIIVYNHRTTNDVINSAIQMQRSLEQRAVAMEEQGGQYIRPIVLFQAQPRTGEENVTFDRIKSALVSVGIPEAQIKIKTADKDELKGLDLLSRDCPVRYIITVNALKEGWDCPFAYILASLANKSSKVDVEQILGRVLRLPYTRRHSDEFLNLSYVFTCSADFQSTVREIIKSLNNAGFSPKDYRKVDLTEGTVDETPSPVQTPKLLFDDVQEEESQVEPPAETPSVEIDEADLQKKITESAENLVKTIEETAQKQSEDYNTAVEQSDLNDTIPNDIKEMVNTSKIKDIFREQATAIQLPQFVRKVQSNDLFDKSQDSVKWIPLTTEALTEGFNLLECDRRIDFTWSEADAVTINLETTANDESTPVQTKLNAEQRQHIKKMFENIPEAGRKNNLVRQIVKNLKFNTIPETALIKYVGTVFEDIDNEKVMFLLDNLLFVEDKFKVKITSLLNDYRHSAFGKEIDLGRIKCEPHYILPSTLAHRPALDRKVQLLGVPKSLYTDEGSVNKFENEVIVSVSNLDNVRFWHRNPERGDGFAINGFLNHYPDFIVWLESGRTILIETKGDDRDNSDSRLKLELGRTWANKAGDDFRYFMVFDHNEMDGAYTKDRMIEMLKEL